MATNKKKRNRLNIAGMLLATSQDNIDAKDIYDMFDSRNLVQCSYDTYKEHIKQLGEEKILDLEFGGKGYGKGKHIIIKKIHYGKLISAVHFAL